MKTITFIFLLFFFMQVKSNAQTDSIPEKHFNIESDLKEILAKDSLKIPDAKIYFRNVFLTDGLDKFVTLFNNKYCNKNNFSKSFTLFSGLTMHLNEDIEDLKIFLKYARATENTKFKTPEDISKFITSIIRDEEVRGYVQAMLEFQLTIMMKRSEQE